MVMEASSMSETSVNFYQATQRYNPSFFCIRFSGGKIGCDLKLLWEMGKMHSTENKWDLYVFNFKKV
jgi:hypothetical protein